MTMTRTVKPMTDRIDKAIEAATGAYPTAWIMGGTLFTVLSDPGKIASWAAAIAGVLFVVIQFIRLYRELVGARIDRERLKDARDDG